MSVDINIEVEREIAKQILSLDPDADTEVATTVWLVLLAEVEALRKENANLKADNDLMAQQVCDAVSKADRVRKRLDKANRLIGQVYHCDQICTDCVILIEKHWREEGKGDGKPAK